MTTPALAHFRDALVELFGWTFADTDVGNLEPVLERRAAHHGLAPADYARRLSAGVTAAERDALTEALTITETYFFRHREQFDQLATEILPERMRARTAAGQRTLRMLSVGCSSGEEAYTLGMIGRQTARDAPWQVSVLGIDANPLMLRRAAAARYTAWALRETPAPERQRWFHPVNGQWEVDADIRADVRFQLHNVVDDDPILWHIAQYDAIFCRNLLMYLTPESVAALVERMTRSLATGGGLFLGHTDTLGRDPAGLRPHHTHASVHYVRTADSPPQQPARRPAPVVVPVVTPVELPAAEPARTGRDQVIRLLAEERYAEALAALQLRPRDDLLYAVVLVHAGRLDEAAAVCRSLIDVDGLDANTHHLLGVCLEGPGDLDAAIAQYRLAAYLDPTFAMPRLRIGLLARRRGADTVAATELERCASLLRYETDERVLFFGGGFARSALVALCRAELDLCGSAR